MVICFVTCIILGILQEGNNAGKNICPVGVIQGTEKDENTRGLVSSQSLVKSSVLSAGLQSCLDVNLLFLGDTKLGGAFQLVTSTLTGHVILTKEFPVSEKGPIGRAQYQSSL